MATPLASIPMRIDGHYDRDADIAWLRFEGYDSQTVISQEVDTGLRELDPATGRVVGLEYWQASTTLPPDLLDELPPPNASTRTRPPTSGAGIEPGSAP